MMIRFSCQWRGLTVGMRVCGNVVSSFLTRRFSTCIWAWVAQRRTGWVSFLFLWGRLYCLLDRICFPPQERVRCSWNGYLSFVFLLTEWGNASDATQMPPSDLTIFGLQKELLKCKQEARNLQGIKVKRKTFNPFNKLYPVNLSTAERGQEEDGCGWGLVYICRSLGQVECY